MKILVCLSFFFLIPLYGNSQENTMHSGGGGGFTIGYGFMDLSPLQKFLPDQYPELGSNNLFLGGMGYGFMDRFIIGGGGSALLGDDISNDSITVSTGGGIGTFNFGYIIVNKDKFRVFPMLGLGGGGYGMNITNNSNISIDDIKADHGQEISINKGGFLMDLSLHMNVIPALHYDDEEGSYGGFMTGLQIGYILGFPDSKWSYTGGNINGGPDFGMNMIYLKLIIGGFGYE